VSLSPDQKRIALDCVDFDVGGRQIWQLDVARGVVSRFTLGDKEDLNAIWSTDGERVTFASNRVGSVSDLYEKPSSGAGDEQLLLQSNAAKLPVDWSPDGRYLFFEVREPGGKSKLWVLPSFGDRKPVPLLQTRFNESMAVFSPDGKWIAYVSDESGRPDVYVQTFPVSTAKWRVSTAGGSQPRWRRDGREIFYVGPDHRLMAVPVKAGASFEAGVPAPLFELGTSFGTGFRYQYDVTSDGQRFFVIRAAETKEAHPITVVLNWTASLKK